MRKRWKGAAALFAAVAVVIALAGCAQPATPATGTKPATEKGPITVGSKIDTEGKLLGTMIVVLLQKNGFKVVDKTQTGPTDVVRKALLSKDIDIYPEYTGNGSVFFKNEPVTVWQNGEEGYATVKKDDLAANGVVWLTPARANNTWALCLKKDFAAANNLKTMSDLAAFVTSGKAVKVVASDEFFNSPAGFATFSKTYGFSLKADQKLILSGGNTAQTEKAVADGTNGVNVGMAYGTDGALSQLGLLVLEDDKGAQPVYWPTPTTRTDITAKYPEIESILKPAFDSLDVAALQELNARIQVNGEAADKVATDYLTKNGFIK